LVLEKNKEVGPKVCAGGLTRKCFEFLGSPKDVVGRSFKEIVFKNFKKKSRLDFGESFIYTIKRNDLGKWQEKNLKETSVNIMKEACVTEINPKDVIINDSEKIGYDFLVGADGSNSLVRRYLGLKTDFIGVAFHYVLPNNADYKDIEIFFDSKLFGAWYSWIFPHKDFVSIGYGCFPKLTSMKKAKDNFESWLKRMKIDVSQGKFEAHPINCDYKGFEFGNIFLVGDAAGLASGFTGEGIYQALASGEDVAKKIINPNHKAKLISEIRRERNIHHFMLSALYFSGPFRDLIFNLVIFAVKSKAITRFLLRVLT
jgi:geranylgeranyl reductase